MDYHARGAAGAMTTHPLAGCGEAQGEVRLFDGQHQHHVGARVDEGTIEVVNGWHGIARLHSMLALAMWIMFPFTACQLGGTQDISF